ncbi:MAG: DCC1-like thiol-disulfide oxidoreductase family protein [Phycisphaerales bacterium]|nr:DCC1-like thiol-disulfide oxidoreductase family protein [Phycisphaerales bacterium]
MPLPSDHPGIDPRHPVLLFDGHCNLCARSVGFIVRHDRDGCFRFAPLQSPAAERLLIASQAPHPLPESMIVVDQARCYTRSDAAIRLARRLPFPWPILTVARAVPRPLRDALYRFVASNRYRLFGRRETCMVPTPQLMARFIA